MVYINVVQNEAEYGTYPIIVPLINKKIGTNVVVAIFSNIINKIFEIEDYINGVDLYTLLRVHVSLHIYIIRSYIYFIYLLLFFSILIFFLCENIKDTKCTIIYVKTIIKQSLKPLSH